MEVNLYSYDPDQAFPSPFQRISIQRSTFLVLNALSWQFATADTI